MEPKRFICQDKEFCDKPCVLSIYEPSGAKLRYCPSDGQKVTWWPFTEKDEVELSK